MNRMTIAMLTHGYLPCVGGAELQLAALAPLLKDRGCDVHIFTRGQRDLPAFEEIDGVPVHRLAVTGPKTMASLSFTLAALAGIRKLRPHVIHAHALLSPTTTALMAKQLFGTPVVAKVLRGGVLGDLDRLSCKMFGRTRVGWFTRNVDAFISISSEIDSELRGIGVPESRRYFIPNGVDTHRFRPLSPQEKRSLRATLRLPDGPLVLFAGRLAAEKRLDQLIGIWPAVRNIHPEAVLLILGEGEERKRLEALCGEGVLMPGRTEDVAPYLQSADLFVLPSATEGLSNALLEALSAGLAAIATSVGGAPDVIIHQQNGWLIPPDEPPVLQEALIELIGNSAERRALGLKGRETVLDKYSLNATADMLANLYRKLAHVPVALSA